MYYSKVSYERSFGIPCNIQYAEVGDDLQVLRVVEMFWDGSLGWGDTKHTEGEFGSILPEGRFPGANEIFSSEGEFRSEIVSKNEFEEIWAKATSG